MLFFLLFVFLNLHSRVLTPKKNHFSLEKSKTNTKQGRLSLSSSFLGKRKKNIQKKYKKLIVIYLHGTFGLREILSITRPIKSLKFLFSLRDAKKKEVWLRFEYQRWAYNKNYFSCIMNEKNGLIFVDNDEASLFNNFSYDAGCNIILLKKYFLEAQRTILDEKKNIHDLDFYVYNWSGSPYFMDRRKEAVKFYSSLESLRNKYIEENIDPVFCVIGYSHGGNLVLDVSEDFVKESHFYIDFLILLGTPILDLTKNNIYLKNNQKKYFFRHVVNVYSPSDKIQVIDFTSPNKGYIFGIRHNFGFSKRRLFSTKKHKRRKRIYNISCSYLFYQKKSLKKKFYFSDIQSGILHLNHYNLAYFRNFYKKTIGKRKHKNFYFPPVLLLVPQMLSLIRTNFIREEIEIDLFFQFLRNTLYLVERRSNNCRLVGHYTLNGLNELYFPLVQYRTT